jgi:trans-aconitate methyltransferase
MAQTTWNTELYNQKHDFVTQYGESVVELLNPQADESILDLGCGSGELTNKIAKQCIRAVGVDFSGEMISKAQSNFPELTFMQHNAEQPFPLDEQFDAVFSNAALHWMMNAEAVIQNIHSKLKPHGRFVFEMGGHGNVAQVLNAIQMAANDFGLGELALINYYPTIGEYSALLEQNGFKVSFATLFDRPTLLQGEHGLANWTTMFRNAVVAQIPAEQQAKFLAAVERHGKTQLFRDDRWYADYVRLRMIAHKI